MLGFYFLKNTICHDSATKIGILIYKSFEIDFEPKWFSVIYTLNKRKSMNVVELANEIVFTHPSTILLLKELSKYKLIKSKKDKADETEVIPQLGPVPVLKLVSKLPSAFKRAILFIVMPVVSCKTIPYDDFSIRLDQSGKNNIIGSCARVKSRV